MSVMDKGERKVKIQINADITASEYEFIKLMAKRDKVTISEEIRIIFNTELRALQDIHGEYM